MKKLYIIRHAKSDWSDTTLEDFDRGLNKRGKKSIPIMAKALNDRKIMPDIILSSSAKRAKLTAKGLAKELGYDGKILFEKTLYFCDPKQWIARIRHINPKYKRVFIIGHNPELTELANILIDESIENIPTLGIVGLEINSKGWEKFEKEPIKKTFFIYPKIFR